MISVRSSIITVFLYCHTYPKILIFLVVISFEPTSYTVTEGDDGFAELILVRSGYLNRTTIVTVTTADGSATGKNKTILLLQFRNTFFSPPSAGSDYTTTSEEVTFEAGSTRTTVTVPITDDNEVENENIFTAVLSSSGSNNIMIGEDAATVTIVDDDGQFITIKKCAIENQYFQCWYHLIRHPTL